MPKKALSIDILDRCRGCGLCVEFCKTGAIGFEKEIEKAKLVSLEACNLCRLCEAHCPDFAIFVN